MENDQIELSFLSMFTLVTFFVFLITSKFSHKIKDGILLDKDFLKPQAFHETAIARCGGLVGIISLNIFFIIYYLIYSKILFEYIFICNLMFIVGFLDDLKINVSPFKRLLIMISNGPRRLTCPGRPRGRVVIVALITNAYSFRIQKP